MRLRGITPVADSETNGAPRTGPEHSRRAEELAAQAHKLLGQGDGQATALVWAAVAQTHAVLALAAATAVGTSNLDNRRMGRRCRDPALVQPVAREDAARGPRQERTGDREVDALGKRVVPWPAQLARMPVLLASRT